ncbi:hypothetical protein POSPLADRAFT_1038599 [Postia placenta MAD-698-R-SB12]|uniref:Glycopeptide n=1 Tax=Postia placenta MAD-698-R-SB12 TaxID=670580 RepID=A0A1X6NCX5_9APHY|nr:hypothetical protein POSPLADRAFT_1038599 [Postia placenta MAD-698-R-SB12]OSX66380.1 hypothetical protein POSPLADRAFT_1038599 [Postia placenta MAD-698-R-SB12]
MSSTLLSAALAAALFATASVRAETHTITFINQCGYGTPQLIQGANILSTGEPYVSNGPFDSAISYLQTGGCGFNGEDCTLLEMTIANAVVAGGGPSADISLISPHSFSVWSSFAYYGASGGCDYTGANCAAANCPQAFYYSDETQVQVACQEDDINLLIAFCADATTIDPSSIGSSSAPVPPSSSYVAPTSTYVAPTTSYTPTSTYVPPTSSYVAPSSSAVPSSSFSSSSASASASASAAARCPNRKRSLQAKRESNATGELEKRVALENHRRHARAHGGSLY